MSTATVVLLLVCLVGMGWTDVTTTKPCILYKCSSTLHEPVCGKQLMKNGCYEVRIFQNDCYMLSANSCGKANYLPCVENKCQNATPSSTTT